MAKTVIEAVTELLDGPISFSQDEVEKLPEEAAFYVLGDEERRVLRCDLAYTSVKRTLEAHLSRDKQRREAGKSVRCRYFWYTTSVSLPSAEDFFAELASQWKRDTAHLSTTYLRKMHPSYMEIIEMGAAAVPLILRELETDPDHWFEALTDILGVDPVEDAHRGQFDRMVETWLAYGREHGLMGEETAADGS